MNHYKPCDVFCQYPWTVIRGKSIVLLLSILYTKCKEHLHLAIYFTTVSYRANHTTYVPIELLALLAYYRVVSRSVLIV
jgi:hypothetical protein